MRPVSRSARLSAAPRTPDQGEVPVRAARAGPSGEQLPIVTPAAFRQAEPDQVCAEAIDIARLAAEEVAGSGQVGAYLGAEADSDRVVTHLFACLSPAYVGWRWAVTVARASRSRQVTVSESLLLPGPDSLLAPQWVPWTERVRPGDLKAGGLMPASADDDRLTPAVVIEGAEGLLDWDASDAWTLGAYLPGPVAGEEGADLEFPGQEEAGPAGAEEGAGGATGGPGAGPEAPAGRVTSRRPARRRRGRIDATARPVRVLSAIGRDEAAARWYVGDHGPRSPIATTAPDNCLTCGFLVRLSGPLGRIFGACANEYSPSDGQIVSFDHGCGAHSDPGRRAGEAIEAGAGDEAAAGGDDAELTVDDLSVDLMAEPAVPEPAQEAGEGTVAGLAGVLVPVPIGGTFAGSLQPGHEPEGEKAKRGTGRGGPHPPPVLRCQLIAEDQQYDERYQPGGRADADDDRVVAFERWWYRAADLCHDRQVSPGGKPVARLAFRGRSLAVRRHSAYGDRARERVMSRG